MIRLRSSLATLRLCALALAALLILALPATASAKRHKPTRDRNHNGLPDKWEKKHGLSTKARGVAKKDNDRDGLNNRAEFRSRTHPKRADSDGDGVRDADEDPDRDDVDNGNEARERTHPRRADTDGDGKRDCDEDADRDRLDNGGEDDAGNDPVDPDTDDDGVKDGDERAGEVVAWDGHTLTLRLFGGSEVSGVVDEDTWIECSSGSGKDEDDDDSEWKARFRTGTHDEDDDSDDSDESDEPDDSDEDSDDSEDDEFNEPDEGDDDGYWGDEEDDAGCTPDALKVGAVVREASFQATGDGVFFDSIELAD